MSKKKTAMPKITLIVLLSISAVLLILLGIASNALSALVGGSHVKEFFSGVLMGMSVAEMLAGVVIVAIHVIHGKCEE